MPVGNIYSNCCPFLSPTLVYCELCLIIMIFHYGIKQIEQGGVSANARPHQPLSWGDQERHN